MRMGNHTDFTAVTIIDADTGAYTLTRVDPNLTICESCGEPAEYLARSEHDKIGQCDVGQCQDCLVQGSGAIMSPAEYVVNS